jgi:hypothetical protein
VVNVGDPIRRVVLVDVQEGSAGVEAEDVGIVQEVPVAVIV